MNSFEESYQSMIDIINNGSGKEPDSLSQEVMFVEILEGPLHFKEVVKGPNMLLREIGIGREYTSSSETYYLVFDVGRMKIGANCELPATKVAGV